MLNVLTCSFEGSSLSLGFCFANHREMHLLYVYPAFAECSFRSGDFDGLPEVLLTTLKLLFRLGETDFKSSQFLAAAG